MKQNTRNTLAVCACATLLATGVALSDHKTSVTAKDSDGKVRAEVKSDQKICQSSKIIGTTVYDSKGEALGKVHDLALSGNGRVEFGLLSLNVAGHEGHVVAVPWQTLSPKDESGLTLNVDREKLLAAKMWNSSAEVNISDDPDFARRTYTYYGLNWDDRMAMGGRVTMPGGVERGVSDHYSGSIAYESDEGTCFPRPQPDGKETFPFLNRTQKQNR